MAASSYATKGHRNNMNSFPRAPRSGSHTWGPSSYNPLQHVAPGNFTYNNHLPPVQAVFYPPPMKPSDYSAQYHGATNIGYDSPVSSNSSSEGSPRPFETRNSISSQGFDGSSEEAVSGVSSPSDDFITSSYFPDHLTGERGCISIEPGTTSHFPLSPGHQKDPRASPPQYPSPNRSRQGSTSFPAPRHIITTDQRNLQKGDELPVSPTNRRAQKQPRNVRRGGTQQKDFYRIPAPVASADDDNLNEPVMATTLSARDQLKICKEVDEVLRSCLFWWLVKYAFDIPRNPRARDIETAEDRDYEGFCSVVNELTAKRWVPRDAVHHERIAELNTVLAGPSEIRHILAHPERPLKSDWRILGLIAAAIEVCKILQYRKGHRQLFLLYQEKEAEICAMKLESLKQKKEAEICAMKLESLNEEKEAMKLESLDQEKETQICAMKLESLKIEAALAEISISKDEKELK